MTRRRTKMLTLLVRGNTWGDTHASTLNTHSLVDTMQLNALITDMRMRKFKKSWSTTKKSWNCKFPIFLYREKQSKKKWKSGKILKILMPEPHGRIRNICGQRYSLIVSKYGLSGMIKGHSQTLTSGWARNEFFFHFSPFSCIFSYFCSNFLPFLPQFGLLGGRLAGPERPWLHHWVNSKKQKPLTHIL